MTDEPKPITLPTGLDILTAVYPDPVWAVPDLLPSGLAFLAGRPKVGKSWLAMQLAQAVATGGYFLGRHIKPGPVLYLALEDSPRRLQERMKAQGWTQDAAKNATILTLDLFRKYIGFLQNTGSPGKLYNLIQQGGYRLVVIDTMSRAFLGLRDQDKSEVVSRVLSPVQELAIGGNFADLVIDHHAKPKGLAANPVDDLMSSTAKSAVADTLMGLYRDDTGKKRLMVTGRDMEDSTLILRWDRETCAYQVIDTPDAELTLTQNQTKIRMFLREHGPSIQTVIANGTGITKNNLSPILKAMIQSELVQYDPVTGGYYV